MNADDIKYGMLERAINGLQSCEKNVIKEAILEIEKIIKSDNSDLKYLYDKLEKPLLNALNGNIEYCREKTVNVLVYFIINLEVDKQYLVLLIPAISKRIGSDEVNEQSEEIRTALINLLDEIIKKYETLVAPYTNDIARILVNGISDSAPQVKRKSCECTVLVTSTLPYEFFQVSKMFIPPLLESIIHQHWRVRVAVIEAIGSVIQSGDNKLVPEVTNPLAKGLFDDSSNVRLAVIKVVGGWMLHLLDRYSFFPVLLPHILTSLTDDNNEVMMTAKKLWEAIGKQYLNENEKDFKDKIDYLNQRLDHYPAGLERPSLGCRCLVAREAYKFLPAISAELSDWLVHVKIKSAQLLSQVILHAESSITQHVHKILQAMNKAATDSEPLVAKFVKLSAEYIGYFVPADVFTKVIVEHISETPTAGELIVVAALVSGSQSSKLVQHLPSLKHLFSTSTIKETEQKGTNDLIKSLLRVCQGSCLTIGEEIWAALITNVGLAASEDIADTSLGLLDGLYKYEKEITKREFHNKYSKLLLNKLKRTKVWTVHCHQQFIFTGIISAAGEVVGDNMDDILEVLKLSTGEESDPEVVLKMVLVVNDILREHTTTLPTPQMVNTFVNSLLNDIIGGLLVWKAGRSAEALRSAATLSLLNCFSLSPKVSISSSFLATLLSLIEDTAPKTRLLALSCISPVVQTLASEPDSFYKTTEVVLKRLDDCDKKVREMSITTLKNLYKGFILTPGWEENLNKALLEYLFGCLLIHLDDQDRTIQNNVLDCLISVSSVDPIMLRDKIKEDNFRDKEICQTLVTYLQGKISSLEIESLSDRIEGENISS